MSSIGFEFSLDDLENLESFETNFNNIIKSKIKINKIYFEFSLNQLIYKQPQQIDNSNSNNSPVKDSLPRFNNSFNQHTNFDKIEPFKLDSNKPYFYSTNSINNSNGYSNGYSSNNSGSYSSKHSNDYNSNYNTNKAQNNAYINRKYSHNDYGKGNNSFNNNNNNSNSSSNGYNNSYKNSYYTNGTSYTNSNNNSDYSNSKNIPTGKNEDYSYSKGTKKKKYNNQYNDSNSIYNTFSNCSITDISKGKKSEDNININPTNFKNGAKMSPYSDNTGGNDIRSFYNKKAKDTGKNFNIEFQNLHNSNTNNTTQNFNSNTTTDNNYYNNDEKYDHYNDCNTISTNTSTSILPNEDKSDKSEKTLIMSNLRSPINTEKNKTIKQKEHYRNHYEGSCNYLIFTQAITPCLNISSLKARVKITNNLSYIDVTLHTYLTLLNLLFLSYILT